VTWNYKYHKDQILSTLKLARVAQPSRRLIELIDIKAHNRGKGNRISH